MAGKDKKKLNKKEQRELEKKMRAARGQAASQLNQDKQKKEKAQNDPEIAASEEKALKIPPIKARTPEEDIQPPFRRSTVKKEQAKFKNIRFDEFTLSITALSPLHLGSGQADVNVDAEVVHDEAGLPYFPAKRLRGLIYESALEVTEMNTPLGSGEELKKELDLLFHHGMQGDTQLIIPNLYMKDYAEMKADLAYLLQAYPELFAASDVLEQFTTLRYQTRLDRETGTAADNTLHNMRVVDEGVVFEGEIEVLGGDARQFKLLALAFKNLTQAGLKRSRGFGCIDCAMLQRGKDIRTPLINEVFKGGKD